LALYTNGNKGVFEINLDNRSLTLEQDWNNFVAISILQNKRLIVNTRCDHCDYQHAFDTTLCHQHSLKHLVINNISFHC